MKEFKVIVGNHTYGMSRPQLDKVLEVASAQIPRGIYAIEKDSIIELMKDRYKNPSRMEKAKKSFEDIGYTVYANWN